MDNKLQAALMGQTMALFLLHNAIKTKSKAEWYIAQFAKEGWSRKKSIHYLHAAKIYLSRLPD